MNKFWAFANQGEDNADLYISGEIVDDDEKEFYKAFWGIDIGTSPSSFRDELIQQKGKTLNVYIDSCGGDVFAASAIYTMLKEHDGDVIVKISSIAASAASVIAMAGNKVLMSSTAVMMIHNPATCVQGDHNDMEKAIEILDTIKNSIINAYEEKSGLSREEISDMMEKETWLDYNSALKLGFCDGNIDENATIIPKTVVENCIRMNMRVYNLIKAQQNDKINQQNDKINQSTEDTKKEPIETDTAEIDQQLFDYLKLKNKNPLGE